MLKYKFGISGYAFVIDDSGLVYIHPVMENTNLINTIADNNYYFVKGYHYKKNGKINYLWNKIKKSNLL